MLDVDDDVDASSRLLHVCRIGDGLSGDHGLEWPTARTTSVFRVDSPGSGSTTARHVVVAPTGWLTSAFSSVGCRRFALAGSPGGGTHRRLPPLLADRVKAVAGLPAGGGSAGRWFGALLSQPIPRTGPVHLRRIPVRCAASVNVVRTAEPPQRWGPGRACR